MKRILLTLLLLILGCTLLRAQEQQTAMLGDCRLESGKVIRDCTVGYRTYGILNREQSNVILFPTAFGWRSAGLASRIGRGNLLDSERYYVIAIDSLADGVSSSPSNSKLQPGLAFPQFSIRDLVEAEYKLVREKLHLEHLHAVVGFSMGGMQALQWAVSYPAFMDSVVSIVGSPSTHLL